MDEATKKGRREYTISIKTIQGSKGAGVRQYMTTSKE